MALLCWFAWGSFHSAKVGLVCSHVWLGHLVAHTNDPNWESGLCFRVTDSLTGMSGMWRGGTRLLSGPSHQLAAHTMNTLHDDCFHRWKNSLKMGLRKLFPCLFVLFALCLPVYFICLLNLGLKKKIQKKKDLIWRLKGSWTLTWTFKLNQRCPLTSISRAQTCLGTLSLLQIDVLLLKQGVEGCWHGAPLCTRIRFVAALRGMKVQEEFRGT